MINLLAILFAFQAEIATAPGTVISEDDRRQIAQIFRSTWENNYRILRPGLRGGDTQNALPELVDVTPISCSGMTPGLRSHPGCELTIQIRYSSGETETTPVRWRFLMTEDGQWWDVGTYLRNRFGTDN